MAGFTQEVLKKKSGVSGKLRLHTTQKNSTYTQDSKKFDKKCLKIISNSGERWRNHKIVGGTEVTPNSHPWQVRLDLGGAMCGGSIIHDNWVVTAAHWCDGMESFPEGVKVGIGWHTMWEPHNGQFELTAEQVITHGHYPGWNGIANDICMIKVSVEKRELFFFAFWICYCFVIVF